MNETPYSSGGLLAAHDSSPKPPKRSSCLLTLLVGFLVFLLVAIIGVWALAMHSSLPWRAAASILETAEEDRHLEIQGLGGSLSSGIEIDKIRWDGGELLDLQIQYSGISRLMDDHELIFQKIHVGKAVIITKWDSETKDESSQSDESAVVESSEVENTKDSLRLFRIDELSLSNILFKDFSSDRSLKIDTLNWSGFKVEDSKVEFGDLKLVCDQIDVTTADAPAPYQKIFTAKIKPGLSRYVLKPFDVTAKCGQAGEHPICDIVAFDRLLTISCDANLKERIHCQGLNLADYFDLPLPRNLTLDAEGESKDPDAKTLNVRGGSFQLGLRSFEIAPQTLTSVNASEEMLEPPMLTAVCRDGGVEVRYRLADWDEGSSKPSLTSEPAMSPEDLMAWVYFNQKFAALGAEDQAKMKRYLSWFETQSE